MINPPVQHRLFWVVLLFLLWISCITLPLLLTPPTAHTLLESISGAFNFSIFSACLLLIAFVIITKTTAMAGFTNPRLKGAWILIYPSTVICVGIAGFIFNSDFRNAPGYYWILINTLLAGFSEELMFRGYILPVATRRFSFTAGVIITSLLFGTIHLINYLTTQDWQSTVLQSLMAVFSGLLFLGIRIKTRSIVPGILVHGLFDFVVMVNISSAPSGPGIFRTLYELLIVVSPLIFGITGIVQIANRNDVAVFKDKLPGQPSF